MKSVNSAKNKRNSPNSHSDFIGWKVPFSGYPSGPLKENHLSGVIIWNVNLGQKGGLIAHRQSSRPWKVSYLHWCGGNFIKVVQLTSRNHWHYYQYYTVILHFLPCKTIGYSANSTHANMQLQCWVTDLTAAGKRQQDSLTTAFLNLHAFNLTEMSDNDTDFDLFSGPNGCDKPSLNFSSVLSLTDEVFRLYLVHSH